MRDMLDSCSALRTRQLPVVLRNPGGHCDSFTLGLRLITWNWTEHPDSTTWLPSNRTKHNGLKDIMKFYTLWILMILFSQIWDDLSYHYYTIIIPLLYHIIILYEPLIFTIQAPLGASLMDTFSTTSPSGSSTSGSSTWAPHGSSLQTQLANAMGHDDTDSIYLSTYLSIDLSGYYAYVGMYTLKYIYIYIVYIYVYTYVCIHGCIHSRTYTHKHTHAYIYIYMHGHFKHKHNSKQ